MSTSAGPGRWSAEAVLALAPDEPARRAATGLARPAPWTGTGATPDLVWGSCAGSGKSRYQIIVELAGPAYKCSCPSRKFPCKHALGLLLTWSSGEVPDRPQPADYALAWVAERRERARKAAARAAPADRDDGAAVIPADPEAVRRRGDAAAARRAQRAERVAGGLSELQEWLRDQVRVGLPAAVGSAGGHSAGGHADVMAARMVDAQAPGVAGALRELSVIPLSGDGWPGRLLAGYAQLHLLARAHERLDHLPAGLAATVRSRVGYTTGRQEVLAEPAAGDRWLVIGVRDIPDGTIPTRRIWVRGTRTGRLALLLAFAVNGTWSEPDTAMLAPGTELDADLHYYPGQPALRALIGQRRTAPAPGTRPALDDGPPGSAAACSAAACSAADRSAVAGGTGGISGLLAAWADGIAADPWLTTWPALLAGTPVAAAGAAGQWHLVDADGLALPLRYADSLWTLLAVSGGYPVTVAGEWQPGGLTPLTVWHGDQAVALS
jgi:hypothetical protein